MNDEEYLYLRRKVLKLTNINLDNYKSQQMRRRLNWFIDHTKANNVVEYTRMLEQDRVLLEKLLDFLTINVSEFFRDPQTFEHLRTLILPQLLKNTSRLNIWCAGCSHGAEPYSIAMILEQISPLRNHRILATDIDENILRRAKAGGPYSADEVRNVRRDIFQKHFTSFNERYMIIDKTRERVEFKRQDLLCDEFEQCFDLIICRNVTIYFTDEAKKELNQKFYHSLKDGGVLFTGGTEAMLDATDMKFKRLIKSSFYQKTAGVPSRRIAVKETALQR